VRYLIHAPTAVRQAPQSRGVQVVEKHPGDEVVVGAIVDKGNGPWLWLADGSGFVPEAHASPLAGQHISEDTPILGENNVTPEQVTRYLLQRTTGEYTEHDIAYGIVPALFAWARRTGVNPLVMAAQMKPIASVHFGASAPTMRSRTSAIPQASAWSAQRHRPNVLTKMAGSLMGNGGGKGSGLMRGLGQKYLGAHRYRRMRGGCTCTVEARNTKKRSAGWADHCLSSIGAARLRCEVLVERG
jgi:hypothetical protein